MTETYSTSTFEAVRRAIQNRKTTKVLAASRATLGPDTLAEVKKCDGKLIECIAAAGMAPFHYDRKLHGIPEPWRFYLLNSQRCQQLALNIGQAFDAKEIGKVVQLLNGCSSLVMVTWLPQKMDESNGMESEKLTQVNEEHLAASAAAVQNLLLLCSSLGWESYWASGGILTHQSVFEELGIPGNEKLLAAVYVDYQLFPSRDVEIVHGKLRDLRSNFLHWTRIVD
ncbi:MAG TPA: nitroreductase family protein [Pirellulaceae bacterium]|nr:nitroreductase family protein [Pirellulaceae bacterium]HMO91423.1 nitroreductase family protein [Pirellulaceae bacterium]HMP69500.1 nitroreductase family protein [Pirellulaceae bacterium]